MGAGEILSHDGAGHRKGALPAGQGAGARLPAEPSEQALIASALNA